MPIEAANWSKAPQWSDYESNTQIERNQDSMQKQVAQKYLYILIGKVNSGGVTNKEEFNRRREVAIEYGALERGSIQDLNLKEAFKSSQAQNKQNRDYTANKLSSSHSLSEYSSHPKDYDARGRLRDPISNLYPPKISTGKFRDKMVGNVDIGPKPNPSIDSYSAKVTSLKSAVNEMKNVPLSTGMISKQLIQGQISPRSKRVLLSKEGARYPDNMLSIGNLKVEDKNGKALLNALYVAGSKVPSQLNSSATNAYFIPQGRNIYIPEKPTNGEPQYAITPDFSGCSRVSDRMGNDEIKVYHVEGGKEKPQYNDVTDHGFGQIDAMEYRDYGYSVNNQGELANNITGQNVLEYNSLSQWHSLEQSTFNAPTVSSLGRVIPAGLLRGEEHIDIDLQTDRNNSAFVSQLVNRPLDDSAPPPDEMKSKRL